MLLSPLSLDSNTLSGQVPALPSSGAGAAAGFAEQLQLVTAMTPPDAPAPVSIPAAASSLPLNSAVTASAIPPAAPIAFHSTAELNVRGVLFSSIVSDAAPQVAVGAKAAPAAPEAPATPISVSNMPAADVKAQEKIAPELQDAAPAIEEAPILASGLPQKSSAPASDERVEHKHHDDADTPDGPPQAPAQPVALAAAAVPAPVHMVLPVSPRFRHSLTPLGNRIPVAMPVASRVPVRAESPAAADPFNSDADPKASVLPAEATKPLVATADQLAFAAKVQVAKPQTVSHRVTEAPATAKPAEPARHEQHSQENSGHRDSEQQFSMKQGESAPKGAVRPAHVSSTFEAPTSIADASIPVTKTGSAGSTRASSATAEDITPTRPEMPAAPMKDISVRIQSEQGENVDVRILHRAGDVQIAVKSASGEMTQGLRHGLSELSDRLNATGYHADTWHPGQAATAADNSADSGNSQQQHSQQQSQSDSQSHSGWSQQQGGRRDDNQNNRPRWIDELESNISSPAETGLFHGLIR